MDESAQLLLLKSRANSNVIEESVPAGPREVIAAAPASQSISLLFLVMDEQDRIECLVHRKNPKIYYTLPSTQAWVEIYELSPAQLVS